MSLMQRLIDDCNPQLRLEQGKFECERVGFTVRQFTSAAGPREFVRKSGPGGGRPLVSSASDSGRRVRGGLRSRIASRSNCLRATGGFALVHCAHK
jgi:hypothetical protein